MGFEVDITLYHIADDPVPIPLDQWLSLAQSQEDLTADGNNQFVYGDGVYFTYTRGGTISVNPRDPPTMRRTTELAQALGAMVIDDQGDQRFMLDGRVLAPDPDGARSHIDEGARWDNDGYWQEPPEEPPLTRWERLGNWWWRVKVAWRTRNI